MNARKHEAPMSNDTRFALLENAIVNINSTLLDIKQQITRLDDKMERRFDAVDRKFEAMDSKFDNKFDKLNNRIWVNFLWLTSMMAALAGLIAHAQHWI